MLRIRQRLLFLLLLFLPLLASAENSTRIPGFIIHHNAIPTAILTPEIARGYGIIRSKYRGLLNVSIIKEVEGSTGTPVEADISAHWRNLSGKTEPMNLRKVTEGNAIYYLGEFPIVDGERLLFQLEVKPQGGDRFHRAELSQDFYIDR